MVIDMDQKRATRSRRNFAAFMMTITGVAIGYSLAFETLAIPALIGLVANAAVWFMFAIDRASELRDLELDDKDLLDRDN